MWLHVDSSPSSCGHILLSVPSVEIYRTDLGTTEISTVYISKSEQVYVHAHSVSNIFLCIAQRDGSHSSPNVSPSPLSVSKDWGISEGKSRLYIWLQALDLSTALALLQCCTRTGPISTAGSRALAPS